MKAPKIKEIGIIKAINIAVNSLIADTEYNGGAVIGAVFLTLNEY